MFNTFLTAFQIFIIGFSFGMVGPCSLSCSPILVTYIAATKKNWKDSFSDIFIFLSGRLLAYIILGFMAGLSAGLLRKFINSNSLLFLKPIGAIVLIILGIFILFDKENNSFFCKLLHNKTLNYSNIFILGFIVGIIPCVPLATLLFEIALMSKNAFWGMFYALIFGIGTFLSGLIIAGSLSGIFTWFPSRILKSRRSNIIFRIICALLFILLGLFLVFGRFQSGYKTLI